MLRRGADTHTNKYQVVLETSQAAVSLSVQQLSVDHMSSLSRMHTVAIVSALLTAGCGGHPVTAPTTTTPSPIV